MGNARNFLSDADKNEVLKAIEAAENNTSGEIMVHIDDKCSEDVLDRAAYVFEMLEMHKTKLRNGVLFYLAYEDHKFAILGDVGINSVVPEHFWDKIRDKVISDFKEGNYGRGLSEGIILAGQELKHHFPIQKDDINELPNTISFGK
jgi:uncharacterized membrane protein